MIFNNNKTLIVAEISANHNGSLQRAIDIITAAAESGADAIKLQTYTADTLTIDCDNEYFKIKGTQWAGKSLYELYSKAFTPWEWHQELFDHAKSLGLTAFSTPFDNTAVDFLETLHVPCHKVASFELVDIPLLRKIGSTGKPVIMSTGMATLEEITEAVETLRNSGCNDLTLLKCTSAYPAKPKDANLRTIPNMKERFDCRVGLSDHTMGIAVPIAAVALGAKVIEKHFTISRKEIGPDSNFSLEPEEFNDMVNTIRAVDAALGDITYFSPDAETETRKLRRSLFAVKDIKEGEPFTSKNVRSIRPGYGLPPGEQDKVMQSIAKCDIRKGTPLTHSLLMKSKQH
ncbi:MAG: pseudaminic acid synthase [Kiritimatiellia bacterium]